MQSRSPALQSHLQWVVLSCLIVLLLGHLRTTRAQFASTIRGNGGTGTSVELTSGGDLLFAGQYSASARYGSPVDFDLQGGTVSAPDGSGCFAAQYAPDGTFQWLWFTEGNNFNRTLVYDAATRPGGGVVLVGAIDGTVDVDPSSATTDLTGDLNVMVVALNASGGLDWAFSLSDGARGRARGVAVDDAGNVYLTGYSGGRSSDLDFDPGAGTAVEPFPDGNAFVASYTPNGTYRWAFTLGDDDSFTGTIVRGNDLTVQGSHVYVAGDFYVTVDFDPGSGSGAATAAGGSGADGFVARYGAATGAFEWVHRYGDRGNDFAYTVAPDGSGGAFVGGSALFRPDDGSAEYGQSYLGRIDALGQSVWNLAVGGPRSNGNVQRDEAYALVLDLAGGEVTIGGQYYADADFDPGAGTTVLGQPAGSDFLSNQAYLATYDLNGGFLRASGFGGTERDAVRGLALSTGDLVAGGTVGPGDVTFPEGTTQTVQDDEPFLLRLGAAPLPAIELLVEEQIGVVDTPTLQKAVQLLVEEQIGVVDTPTLQKAVQLLVEERVRVQDAPGYRIPSRVALQTLFVSGDGRLTNRSDIGVDLVISGASGFTDITALRIVGEPQLDGSGNSSTAGNAAVSKTTNTSTYRWIIAAEAGFSIDSGSELRFSLTDLQGPDTIADPGIDNPEAVEVFFRPTPGAGTFQPLSTRYEAGTDEIVASGMTTFGEFIFRSDTEPLPVELATFGSTSTFSSNEGRSAPMVNLTWTTVSETDNAYFHIERAIEPASPPSDSTALAKVLTWTEVGTMPGAGTTSEAQTYRFTDTSLPFETRRAQYRLRQVDLDGSASLSDPIRIKVGNPKQLRLHAPFPNPARRQVTLRYELPADGPVRLEVYDVLGRRLQRLTASGSRKAGRVEERIDTSRLVSGHYFLRLIAADQVRTTRFVVIR